MALCQMKNYFREISYEEFLENTKLAREREPSFHVKIRAFHKKIAQGIPFWQSLVIKLKNRIGIYLLSFLSLFLSSSEILKKCNLVIIFTSSSPSTYMSQFKILKRLDELNIPVVIVTLKKIYKAKEKELKNIKRFKFIFLDQEIKKLSFKDFRKAKKRAREQTAVVLSSIEDGKLIKVLNSYRDLIELNLQIQNFIEAVYKKLFFKIEPKIIVANAFQGGLLKSLEGRNIRSIALQHGATAKKLRPGFTRKEDELIIWGDFWKDIFRNKISSKTKLISLGCARFDDMTAQIKKPREESFYKKFNLNPQNPTIVFFSSTFGGILSSDFYKTVVQGIGALKKEMGNKINLVIRLHPSGESKDFYLRTLGKSLFKEISFIGGDASIYEVLRHCDILFTPSSTVLLEGMFFQIPVIQFNPQERSEVIEYAEDGGGLLTRDKDSLISEIKALIFNESYRREIINKQSKFIEESVLINIGKATDKIVEYLLWQK